MDASKHELSSFFVSYFSCISLVSRVAFLVLYSEVPSLKVHSIGPIQPVHLLRHHKEYINWILKQPIFKDNTPQEDQRSCALHMCPVYPLLTNLRLSHATCSASSGFS